MAPPVVAPDAEGIAIGATGPGAAPVGSLDADMSTSTT
jgi:hypothetical protein